MPKHGIGQPWVGGNPPSSGSFDMKFSQYFSINKGSAYRKHIEAPKKHEIKNEIPTTVYFSYQMQAVPYTQYKTYSTYTGVTHSGYRVPRAGHSMPKFYKVPACLYWQLLL
jgi:hypothetical protein